MNDVNLESISPHKRFGYIIGRMLAESNISRFEFAQKTNFKQTPRESINRLIANGTTRETADAHKIMQVILNIVRSDVGAKWIFPLQKAYDALPSNALNKERIIDPERHDFGAVLGRILIDANISYGKFSRWIKSSLGTRITSRIVNGQSVTKNWVDENNIVSLLEKHCPQSLAKYKDQLTASINQLESKQDIIANDKDLQLSQAWAQATATFIQQALDHSGDDIDDAIDDLMTHKLSYRLKFLQEAQNWRALATGEVEGISSAPAFRNVVTIVSDTYHIDKHHPLYQARRTAELALEAK